MKRRKRRLWLAPTLAAGLSACDPEQARDTADANPPPAIERFPHREAFFGDLHVHTSWSTDAFFYGNRVGPRDAWRFAQGDAVRLPTGIVAQLAAPLDFAAITDHAEGFDQIATSCSAMRTSRSTRSRRSQPPCEVLTIPHNTNYSWGLAFARTDLDGSEYADADLERRARMERLAEVTQRKGSSECQHARGHFRCVAAAGSVRHQRVQVAHPVLRGRPAGGHRGA